MDPIDEQLQIEYEYMQGEFIEDEDEVVIDDTDSEEESDDEYTENWIVMYYDEEEYRDSDKMNKKLYIGLPGYVRKTGNFVLLSCVSAKTFHRYNIDPMTRNVGYNVLDLFSKCFVGIFFWAYYTKVFKLP